MAKPVKLPYAIRRVVLLQQKLATTLLTLHGYSYEGEAFDRFVDTLHDDLPRADRDALQRSLWHLAGTTLLDRETDELSWRLAGNYHLLCAGEAVSPWIGQGRTEWVPMHIESAHRTITQVGEADGHGIEKSGVLLHLLVLGGPPAGRRFEKTWSSANCHRLKPLLGFSRFNRSSHSICGSRRHHRPLLDLTELTRLRFLGRLTPESCAKGLDFDDVAANSTTIQWNRRVMALRQRVDFACPLELTVAELPCYSCDFGLDRCRAACHPVTYERRPCEHCGREEAAFDPGDEELCVRCRASARLRRLKH
jgi:hypothetical protein